MNRPLACCDACKGTGRAPISYALAETLVCVRDTPSSTSEIRARGGLIAEKQTGAINNRLAKLAKLGLVVREERKDGRDVLWRLA